jgi:predicted N-acyltransferase
MMLTQKIIQGIHAMSKDTHNKIESHQHCNHQFFSHQTSEMRNQIELDDKMDQIITNYN